MWFKASIALVFCVLTSAEFAGTPPNCDWYRWDADEPVPTQVRECVTFRSTIRLQDTLLQNVSFLAKLQSAEDIILSGNAKLLAVDLPSLVSAHAIKIRESPQMSRFTAPLLRNSDLELMVLPHLSDLQAPTLEQGSVTLHKLAIKTLSLPGLQRAPANYGGLSVTSCDNITTLDLPVFADGGSVSIWNNMAVVSIKLPVLKTATGLTVSNNWELTTVELPSLGAVGTDGGDCYFKYNSKLQTVSAPVLQSARRLLFQDDIAQLQFPMLKDCKEFVVSGPTASGNTRLEHLGFESLDLSANPSAIRLLTGKVCCTEVNAFVARVHAQPQPGSVYCKQSC